MTKLGQARKSIGLATAAGHVADNLPTNKALAAILDTVENLIVVIDRNGDIVHFNRACQQTTGFSPEEVLGRPVVQLLVPPEEREDVGPVVDQITAGQFPSSFVNHWLTKDGNRRLIAWNNNAILDDAGKVELVIGTGIDISERRQLEQRFATAIGSMDDGFVATVTDISDLERTAAALRESELRFRTFAKSASDWLWEMDADLRFTFFSDSIAEVTGRPAAWHLGKSRAEIVEELGSSLDIHLQHEDLAARRPFRDVEFSLPNADGETRWISSSGDPQFDMDGTFLGYRGVARDITARKKAEANAAWARRTLADAIASNPSAMIIFDADDRALIWNDTYVEMFPHHRPLLKPGTPFSAFVENTVRAGAVRARESNLNDWAVSRLAKHRDFDEPHEIEMADGRWFLVAERPMSDGGNVIVCTDITQLKNVEQELNRSNAELEQFAYVASHDLKAPLRGIENLTNWIAEDAGDDPPGEMTENLALLQSRVRRMDRLLEDLLSYSRANRMDNRLETVDLSQLIEDIVELSGKPEGTKVEISNECPTLVTAPNPLRRVLANLVENAVKHMDGERLHIAISVRDDGEFLRFSLRDNGPGIPRKFHQRVFGMFQTLKSRDKIDGSGIGLSLVKKIVEWQGGQVSIDSDPESGKRGTTITFLWRKEWQGGV